MESFETIYSRMKEKYRSLTGDYPAEASNTAIRLKLLAGEILSCRMNMDFIKNQTQVNTASGEYLDYHGEYRGIYRKQPQKAVGEVTFYLDSDAVNTVTIPSGTAVSTSGEQALVYKTDEPCSIEYGESSVTVGCTAFTGGSKGNVQANRITVICSPADSGLKMKNESAFTGGTDLEDDESFRRRITATIVNPSNGCNSAYYKKLAQSVDGVESAGVIPLERGAGTVNVYICKKGASADDGLIAETQALIDQKREINTDVLVKSASPLNVSVVVKIAVKEGFSYEEIENACTAKISQYISSRGVGVPVLMADIGKIIYEIPGVANYGLTAYDKYPEQNQFASPGVISIKQVDK